MKLKLSVVLPIPRNEGPGHIYYPLLLPVCALPPCISAVSMHLPYTAYGSCDVEAS